MLGFILIVALIVGVLTFALAGFAVIYSLYSGWFTLPGPGPDRERSKIAPGGK